MIPYGCSAIWPGGCSGISCGEARTGGRRRDERKHCTGRFLLDARGTLAELESDGSFLLGLQMGLELGSLRVLKKAE